MLPAGRSCHSACFSAEREQLVVYGGQDGGGKKLGDIRVLDIGTLVWSTRPALIDGEVDDDAGELPRDPEPVAGHTLTLLPNGTIVLTGADDGELSDVRALWTGAATTNFQQPGRIEPSLAQLHSQGAHVVHNKPEWGVQAGLLRVPVSQAVRNGLYFKFTAPSTADPTFPGGSIIDPKQRLVN